MLDEAIEYLKQLQLQVQVCYLFSIQVSILAVNSGKILILVCIYFRNYINIIHSCIRA